MATVTNKERGTTKRTSAGLRDSLFEELDMLRRGESNPAKANAVSKLADTIISTVEMELQAQRILTQFGKNPPSSALPEPLILSAV